MSAAKPASSVPIRSGSAQEHLLSSEIHKIYANRLRLEQRIKQFYGLITQQSFKAALLSSAGTKSRTASAATTSVWNSLLKLEDRLDIQVFRLKWASSIASARQILKHKHIGIIKAKDATSRHQTADSVPTSAVGVDAPQGASKIRLVKKQAYHGGEVAATGSMFLSCGDLLYWRDQRGNSGLSQQEDCFATTDSARSYHQFPWFVH